MLLNRLGQLEENRTPLDFVEVDEPVPGQGEILVRVSACGVCRTELDEIEGRTPPPRLPVIPGHQVVGRVAGSGEGARLFQTGQRVGIAWIYSACGACRYCLGGQENLCPEFKATGRDADGGYAGYLRVPETFASPIPEDFSDVQAAPLLCAGAVGYRSQRLAGLETARSLGLLGFGASNHLVLMMVRSLWPDIRVYAFARRASERAFALELGAAWAGGFTENSPEPLDRIIDTTPAWGPVLEALEQLAPGGRLVINAIRKEASDLAELQRLDYPAHLWMEKEIKSVANVSRADVTEFLELAGRMRIRPEVQEYALAEANQALVELKTGRIRGAKVLRID